MYDIITRFSIINKETIQWKTNKISFQEQCKLLLNEERLKIRSDIFFEYQLPIIANLAEKFSIKQTVFASTLIPQWLKDKFNFWEKKLNFLTVNWISYEEDFNFLEAVHETVKEHILSAPNNKEQLSAVVRLDDDDLLSPTFFYLMQEYLTTNFAGMTICLSSGYEGLFTEKYEKFSSIRYINHAQGLTYIAQFNREENKFTTRYFYPPGQHMDVDTRSPTINDSRCPTFIYTWHNNNGSNFCSGTFRANHSSKFERTIDIQEVTKLFPSLLLHRTHPIESSHTKKNFSYDSLEFHKLVREYLDKNEVRYEEIVNKLALSKNTVSGPLLDTCSPKCNGIINKIYNANETQEKTLKVQLKGCKKKNKKNHIFSALKNLLFQSWIKKKAFTLCNAGNLKAAKRIVKDILLINPTTSWAYYILGKCHHQQGQYEKAIKNIQIAINIDPKISYYQTYLNYVKRNPTIFL